MKRLIFFCYFLLKFLNFYSQKATEIFYLGNEGFMIKTQHTKLFIDALYYDSQGRGILNVDTFIQNKIIENQAPFDSASFFLITHNHPDHWKKEFVLNYLKNNPAVKLLAPDEITSDIKSSNSIAKLTDFHPDQYESVDTTINNVQISASNLLHNTKAKAYNLGYLVKMDGFTFFHGGDNIMEDTLEYTKLELYKKNIDVAFLNYNGFWKTKAQRDFVKRQINPRFIVLMHIQVTNVTSTQEAVKSIESSFPKTVVFSASMEKISVDDSVRYVNVMPKIIGKIEDFTLLQNAKVQITIPKIFEDSDGEDSITYSMSGLPLGIWFDKKNFVLTGTPENSGSFSIRFKAMDKNFASSEVNFKINVNSQDIVNQIQNDSLSIYPNPCHEILNLKNIPKGSHISIYSLQGQLMREILTNHNHLKLNVSSFCNGLYILKISEMQLCYKLFIVRK